MAGWIGAIIIFLSLAIILYLTLWSRRTIDFIHKNKLDSAREILKKLNERR